jgi:hypothetical protein
MKIKMILTAITLMVSWQSTAIPAAGKDGTECKYSNIGLKLNLGLGSQDVSSSQNLEKGDAASLSLGYGVSQRVTLWLGVNSGKHPHELNPPLESHFVGLEINLQYKLRPNKKLRPYGAIGIGTFFLGDQETDVVQNGGGVTWALGAEYWLVRFLSIGAEFFWKDFDYTQQRVGEKSDFTKMERPISGDTNGFMIKFTLH